MAGWPRLKGVSRFAPPPGVTFEETIAASRRLDTVLKTAIAEIGSMPEAGGRRLAGEFKGLLGELRQLSAEVRTDIASAAAELMTELKAGKEVARQIREETAEVRAAFGEVLGNAPPADESKPEGTG